LGEKLSILMFRYNLYLFKVNLYQNKLKNDLLKYTFVELIPNNNCYLNNQMCNNETFNL
jgi:hypothetical protein